MAKFYVESDQLRQVIEADRPVLAACKALTLMDEKLELAPIVTVNEGGYVCERPFRQRYATDLVLETGTLLSLMAEHEI